MQLLLCKVYSIVVEA